MRTEGQFQANKASILPNSIQTSSKGQPTGRTYKCPSCDKFFVHLKKHSFSCIPKKLENDECDRVKFINHPRAHETKCTACLTITTTDNYGKHKKRCKGFKIECDFLQNKITFEMMEELLAQIRKKNLNKSQCIYCYRRVSNKLLKSHLKTCETKKDYFRYKFYYDPIKHKKIRDREIKINEQKFKEREKREQDKLKYEEDLAKETEENRKKAKEIMAQYPNDPNKWGLPLKHKVFKQSDFNNDQFIQEYKNTIQKDYIKGATSIADLYNLREMASIPKPIPLEQRSKEEQQIIREKTNALIERYNREHEEFLSSSSNNSTPRKIYFTIIKTTFDGSSNCVPQHCFRYEYI